MVSKRSFATLTALILGTSISASSDKQTESKESAKQEQTTQFTKEYMSARWPDNIIYEIGNDAYTLETLETRIPFENRNPLLVISKKRTYLDKERKFLEYIIVPGYIIDTRKNEREISVTNVLPVPQDDQETIIKILKDRNYRGPINFWN